MSGSRPTRPAALLALLLVGFSSPGSDAGDLPAPLEPRELLRLGDVVYRYDAASAAVDPLGTVTVAAYGEDPNGVRTASRYEFFCVDRTFRLLATAEERNGRVSRCVTPTDPIALRSERHPVPGALHGLLCRQEQGDSHGSPAPR